MKKVIIKLYKFCTNCGTFFTSPRKKGLCKTCELIKLQKIKNKGEKLNEYF